MKELGAPQGFSFLTGNTDGSDAIQRALTGQVARGMAHTAFIYIVGPKGYWTRMPVAGTTPQALAERMRQASELGLTETQIAGRYFTNLPVLDQHGREQRFYRDLMQGHTVVINTLFTRCGDACPLIAEKLARVHALLGPQHDVRFVSISSDPAYDLPERLRTFAAERSLPEQWTLLTGKPENVAWLLGRLGLSSEEPSAHPTQVLVVNERTMELRRLSPAATPQQIADAIRDADAAARHAARAR
jgi:cytochrome oxidase Cu insertion factor (SCO1/SenC/PrrC family)